MPTMSSRRALQTHVLEDAAPCAPAATLCVRVCVCVLQVKPKAQQSSGLLAPKKGNGDWVMKTPERRRFCLRQGLAQRYWFSENVGKLPFKSKALAASVGSAHPSFSSPCSSSNLSPSSSSPCSSSTLSPSSSSNPEPNCEPAPAPGPNPSPSTNPRCSRTSRRHRSSPSRASSCRGRRTARPRRSGRPPRASGCAHASASTWCTSSTARARQARICLP